MPRETHTRTDSPFVYDVNEIAETLAISPYARPMFQDKSTLQKFIGTGMLKDAIIADLQTRKTLGTAVLAVTDPEISLNLRLTDEEKRFVLFAATARQIALMKTGVVARELGIQRKIPDGEEKYIAETILGLEIVQDQLLRRK